MSTDAIAADAATTDWRTYDGAVPAKFTFYVVLFPLLMFTFIVLPTLACCFFLGGGTRGKIAQYYPPNRRGRGFHGMYPFLSHISVVCTLVDKLLYADSRISPFHGNLEHGLQAEKF